MLSIIVTLLGGIVLLLGLGSKLWERTPIPATLLALLTGIIIGPEVFNFIDLNDFGEKSIILEEAARITLGIGLISVALRIPKAFPKRHWKELITLIGLAMILMWLISTIVIFFILGIPFWLAALIGAIISPTDPIASSPIVTGPTAKNNIPERIRNMISFETGANDGLSYLFVFLPLLLLTRSVEETLSYWFIYTLLWEVVFATLFGMVFGYTSAKALQFSEHRNLIEEDWRLIYTVALALLAVGAGKLIHSDEVLVVFAAGVTFVQVVNEEDRGAEEKGQEAFNRFFSIPIFALLGTAIPWQGWYALGWSGVILVFAVLLFRRLPVLLLIKPLLPSLQSKRDAMFIGWFGPIAVAAIYYGSLTEHRLKEPFIWDVVSLIICSSVLFHGLSAVPLTRIYGQITEKKKMEYEM